MSEKYIKSLLSKQTLWQVHIPPPKEIHQPNYDVTKPNEQNHFDLLYMPHNLFEGNTYKYILTSIDVASRPKVATHLRTKKSSKVAFKCWKQSIKRVACLSTQRTSNAIMVLSLKMN